MSEPEVQSISSLATMQTAQDAPTASVSQRVAEGPPVPKQKAVTPLSPAEVQARQMAALGIEAQPRDVQRRYYTAHLRTQKQGLGPAQERLARLQAQQAADATARAQLNDLRDEAEARLKRREQRIADLQSKLDSL